MDRSCEATIYPVLDKPHTTGAFQDRRKIEALIMSVSFVDWVFRPCVEHLGVVSV